MTNGLIGIVAAIGLTFLLFVLRHFILSSARHNKRRHAIAPRETYEPDQRDDAWLQWAPNVEKEVRVARGQSHEPRLRQSRRDDRTIGGEIR